MLARQKPPRSMGTPWRPNTVSAGDISKGAVSGRDLGLKKKRRGKTQTRSAAKAKRELERTAESQNAGVISKRYPRLILDQAMNQPVNRAARICAKPSTTIPPGYSPESIARHANNLNLSTAAQINRNSNAENLDKSLLRSFKKSRRCRLASHQHPYGHILTRTSDKKEPVG